MLFSITPVVLDRNGAVTSVFFMFLHELYDR